MTAQPFRAVDVVEVPLGPHKGEKWVVAVYDVRTDTAYIAGWPCTMVTKATEALRLVERASDEEHAEMVDSVPKMHGDHGEGDPRRQALEHVLAAGVRPMAIDECPHPAKRKTIHCSNPEKCAVGHVALEDSRGR